ncbi:MAG: helix-turn-helix domain-containing protein [Clostridia bacterium]|nr:helix-turn-helix domain-containing protein [Clostridia bacterium]
MFNRIPMEEQPEINQAENETAAETPKMVLTMTELAKEFHISKPTARKLVRQPGFPAFYVGARILINREALQRWMDEQPPLPAA